MILAWHQISFIISDAKVQDYVLDTFHPVAIYDHDADFVFAVEWEIGVWFLGCDVGVFEEADSFAAAGEDEVGVIGVGAVCCGDGEGESGEEGQEGGQTYGDCVV